MKKIYFEKTDSVALKFSFLMAMFVVLFSASANAQLVHPGGWLKQAELSTIREKVAAHEEPWYSAWLDIKDSDPGTDYTASVSATITNHSDIQSQGHAAYVLAIKWVVTGDQAYATAAINVIDAWANTVTVFDIKNSPLRQGIGSNKMANAAEILAWGFDGEAGWSSEGITTAQNWFKNVVYPYTSTGESRTMNWGTSCIAGNMSMAIFCDNYTMFDDACEAYKYGFTNTSDGCCGVEQYIINTDGQCYESGRDQSHTQGGIAHLVEPAMIAWNQGVDLVSYADYRLVAGIEYTAKYNLWYDVSWTSDIPNPCNIKYNWTDSISIEDRGDFSPIYMMASTLFERAGQAHPYTLEVIASSNYAYPETHNDDHPGLGTLIYSAEGELDNSIVPYLATEAEDYVAMLGVDSTVTTDERGGYKISSIDVNDWMEYEIVVPASGTFSFDYRVSSVTDGDFTVKLNGEPMETITFDATGGDETWETVSSVSPIYLSEGTDTLRIISNSEGWNLNWVQLIADCYASVITPRINTIDLQGAETGFVVQSDVTLYPGFSVDLSPLPDLDGTWSWSGPNDFSSDDRVVSLSEIQKNQSGDYIAVYTNDCGVESEVTFSLNVQDSVYIEAEDYTLMNAVTVEATSDMSGDSSLTSVVSGSWMEYEVEIPFSALYSFSYRVASENTDSFDVSIDSEIIDQVSFNATEGSQTWTNVNPTSTLYLKAGVQTLRITSKSEGWKLNYIELKVADIVSECNLPYTNDGFSVRNTTTEWTTGLMDISCETDVNINVIIDGFGSLAESDYLNIYYKLDNGDTTILAEKVGDVSEMMISSQALIGTTLELIIEGHSESSSQYYKVTQIIIENGKDPLAKIEAEDYDEAYGTNTETCKDTGGGENVGSINSENWLKFSNINLSEVHSVSMRLASTLSGGTVEVRLGSETGDIIGSLEMPNTGNWQTWQTVTTSLENRVGFYDVYIVFVSSEKYVGNINWLQFSSAVIEDPASIESAEITSDNFILYPNPVDDVLNILDNEGAQLRVINQAGKVVLRSEITSNQHRESFSDIAPGIYVVQLLKDDKVRSYRVVCM